MTPDYLIVELQRQLANLIRVGTVQEVSGDTCRVACAGGLLTAPLPWLTRRAGAAARDWAAPSVGEQVLVLAPGGDLAQAVALPSLYQDAHPAPEGGGDVTAVHYPDGTVFRHSPGHSQIITAGTVEVTASGGVTIVGDVAITGNLTASGDMAASGDVTAGAISLQQHVHGGVFPGGSSTGAPQ